MGSDAFFPFGDNIERAHKSGVDYIAQEWRLVQFCDPVEAGYDFIGANLVPYVDYAIPFGCLRRIALMNLSENSLTYSALAGFLQSIGLAPDRYLEGMLEE